MSPPTVLSKNHVGYDWVLLNSRWYIVQNYSPTKLADDTDIPVVTDGATWAGLTTPARCVYNNSTEDEFIAKYGYLYNWYAVDDSLKMPCAGCHVPSSAEWDSLLDWMIASGFNWDGTTEDNKIGKSLASNGGEWSDHITQGRVGNDQASNNSSGFSVLPGGDRGGNGGFSNVGNVGRWWSATEYNASDAWRRFLGSNLETLRSDSFDKSAGLTVRISATAPVVTFNSNGGSAVADEVTFVGELATEPTSPTRAGYNFSGWYSDEALTTEWDFETDTVTEDTTLYAKWGEILSVTFDSQGGSAVDTVIATEGSTIDRPADPIKAEHSFVAWYKDTAWSEAWNFNQDVVTESITLYAKWENLLPLIREMYAVLTQGFDRNIETGEITYKNSEGIPLFKLLPLSDNTGRTRSEIS